MALTLLVYILDLSKSSFQVTVQPSETVSDLKRAILMAYQRRLDVDDTQLILYKVDICDGPNLQQLAPLFKQEELNVGSALVSELFPNAPPERTVSIVASIDASGIVGAWLRKSKSTDLDPYVTFIAPRCGHFGYMSSLSDNYISESEVPPQFVAEFEQLLSKPRRLAASTQGNALQNHLTEATFQVYFTDGSGEQVSNHEHRSYLAVFGSPVMKKKTDVQKAFDYGGEAFPHYFLMELAVNCEKCLGKKALYSFGKSWQFPLIAKVQGATTSSKYSYKPRSNFLLSFSDIPIVTLEVCSDRTAALEQECDRPRLLLQAACAVRLLNHVTDKPNVILAVYIDKYITASCYYLFEVKGSSPGPHVQYYMPEMFDLGEPLEGFRFLFRIYNFVSEMRKKFDKVKFKQNVSAFFTDPSKDLPGFTTKTSTKRCQNKDGDGEGGQGDAKRPRHQTLNQPTVTQALAKEGYGIQLEEEIDGRRPRHQLKPTLSRAMFQGSLVMLKLLDEGSTELEILQFFNGKKSSANHVIALLDAIHLDVGAVVALPIAHPLGCCGFTTPAIALDLMEQLVEAVDFIHTNGVAHLDLKPDNIVVSTSTDDGPRLAVIDFGVSIFVKSPEDEVEGFIGTKDWVAPEVGAEDGPHQRYSAIRADRWACGKLLLHMAQDQPMSGRMTKLVKGLMSTDPLERPSLGTYFTEARKATKRSSDNSQALAPKRQCQGLQTGRPDIYTVGS